MTGPLQCDNCGKGFAQAPTAPAKRFCSATCRHQWHDAQRRKALQLLREHEANIKEPSHD